MNGFEKRRLQKMQQIKQTAFSLFSKFGVQKVSIQDIAKKANVSQVTIYNYFGSKDELLIESLKEYLEEQLSLFLEVVESKRPFTDKIQQLFEMKIDTAKSFSPALVESLFMESGPTAELIQYYSEEKMFPQLMRLLDEGREQGIITKTISTETLLFLLNSMTAAVQQHPQLFSTEEKTKEISMEMLHFFFYGVMGREIEKD
ncbi:TetR/AcrR family transcriptional regulator [Falsibacillus pallidus]|uniref:TetR family transcriptional regulator n=1 Tax=Falsibacillus pallidus TaxID=493781 RepID=A0A370GWB3_9BACI|nr:TetR/AcrR family transcriptional regulator [Falsibacillus pallidus]RDI47948.1 TetR family transcriptional regulator [Falsibacillus pallidus]